MHRNVNASRPLSSSQQIYEMYLFVNPIGLKCYNTEQEVLHFIEAASKAQRIKIHFRFITFHNFTTVTQFMKRMNLPTTDLQLRNHVYQIIYDASLAYKAALMQGKKVGRKFLLFLQEELSSQPDLYDDTVLERVARRANLDIPMFLEDKASDFVKTSYETDQTIGQEMNIVKTPSLVIFNNDNHHYGVLLEDNITFDLLEEAIGLPKLETKPKPIDFATHQFANRKNGKDYLTLIK